MTEYIISRTDLSAIQRTKIDLYGGVELVRCKDCKYYIDDYCDHNGIYQMLSGDLIGVYFEPTEDFYCGYGKRKEDEQG